MFQFGCFWAPIPLFFQYGFVHLVWMSFSNVDPTWIQNDFQMNTCLLLVTTLSLLEGTLELSWLLTAARSQPKVPFSCGFTALSRSLREYGWILFDFGLPLANVSSYVRSWEKVKERRGRTQVKRYVARLRSSSLGCIASHSTQALQAHE